MNIRLADYLVVLTSLSQDEGNVASQEHGYEIALLCRGRGESHVTSPGDEESTAHASEIDNSTRFHFPRKIVLVKEIRVQESSIDDSLARSACGNCLVIRTKPFWSMCVWRMLGDTTVPGPKH